MEPALPMPPVEELDVMFSELVVSCGHLCRAGGERGREKKGSTGVGGLLVGGAL